MLRGSCHCGNLTALFAATRAPEELDVRACGCSFCRKHGALSTSDPAGRLSVAAAEPGEVLRYRFGLRSADFLICRRCGVYVGAIMREGDAAWGIVNVLALDARDRLVQPPRPMDYEGEDLAARLARRKARWTPAAPF